MCKQNRRNTWLTDKMFLIQAADIRTTHNSPPLNHTIKGQANVKGIDITCPDHILKMLKKQKTEKCNGFSNLSWFEVLTEGINAKLFGSN